MTERWIVCLKHGTKYSSEYVNKLYNMTKRHSTVPFRFACITEDASNLNKDITVIPLPNFRLSGWWYKPWVFSPDFPLNGTILFLDLDIVIVKNIDNLWMYSPDQFCIIRDFNRSTMHTWDKFNSSVFRFNKGTCIHVWTNLIKDLSQTNRMHGDQDWIYKELKNNYKFWPDEWIQSYKWEVRDRADIVRIGTKRRFKNVANPVIKDSTSILVFHGEPNPHDVEDPIIVDNWQ